MCEPAVVLEIYRGFALIMRSCVAGYYDRFGEVSRLLAYILPPVLFVFNYILYDIVSTWNFITSFSF